MGTSYEVHKDKKSVVELDEMSNTLTLTIDDGGVCLRTERLAPSQVIEIALQMLKVCSYWIEEGAVEKAITEFKAKGYYW